MRRTALACLGFTTLAFAPVLLGSTQVGCSNQPQGEHVIRSAQPIQGGTVDQGDLNVVGILIGQNGQLNSLCSGSLIGPNLILTAHHCVANPPNNLVCGGKFSTTITGAANFMVTTSYNAAYNIWISSNPTMPTADGVTWWGVSKVDVPSTNNVCAGDQALLTLSSSITGVCPLIPAVDVQPTDGETYTAVGFGITSPTGQNAGERYKVTGMTVQCVGSADCQDTTIAATGEWEGGSTSNKGTCEGDSGGPALDASNRIIGTVSRGPSNACNSTVYESTYDSGGTTNGAWIKTIAQQAATAGGYTVAGWVTGGATSDPNNGYCGTGSSSSSSSSGTTSSSSSSSSSSSGSTSGGPPTTCSQADGNAGCCEGSTVYYCTNGTGSVLSIDCTQTPGYTCGWNASRGYYDCVPSPGGADPSGTYPLTCGGSTSSSSSSSSGTTSSSSSSSSSSGCVPSQRCPTGQNCGTYPDGCGGLVNCGTCPTGQTCGAGGTPNVCGTGTSSSSSSSSSGTASSSSSSSSGCVPLATCPSGLNCGTYDNGCGGLLFCGTCASGQTCSSNVCGTGSSSSSSSSGGAGDAGAGGSGGAGSGDAGTGGSGDAGTGGTGGGSGSSSSSSGFSTGGSGTGGSGGSGVGGSVSGSSGTSHAPGTGQNGGCSCEAAGTQEGSSHLSFSAFGMLALAGMVRARKRRSA